MAMKPTAVLLDVMPDQSRKAISDRFEPHFDVRFARSDDRGDLLRLVHDADVLLGMWGQIDAELIASANSARIIQKLGVGVDKIDVDAAARQRVAVFKAAGINADAVAETAILLTLAVSRNLMKAVRESRAGHFEKEVLRAETFQLTGKTFGLFGLGNIGQGVAKRLHAFGVDVIYTDVVRAPEVVEQAANATFVSFDELLKRADILSLHVPSTPETTGLFNRETFTAMKQDAILINTARGALVNEDDLAEAIRSGHILGAGLDVTVVEPLPASSPLFELDRVIVTPHIAGAVGNNFPNVVSRAYDNITSFLAGKTVRPEDVVTVPGD
jgi:phosphoglycerate dehydrogenase-like enzyme